MGPHENRLDALERRVHRSERQTRWWRGLAIGLLVLAVLTWVVPGGTAEDEPHGRKKTLEQRVAALESLLKHFARQGNNIFISGANLHLRNGLGSTDCIDPSRSETIPNCPNGLGNLIIGYNEQDEEEQHVRTGQHNVVIGMFHDFSRYGGVVVGERNRILGDFSSVSGGIANVASGKNASVSGGFRNTAGGVNEIQGEPAATSVTGGEFNTASGLRSSISGGVGIGQDADQGWAAGSFGDEVIGSFRSP
jgi:hypothetical protein